MRTNPDAKAQEGISFLLIDMKTPGITVRPIVMLDGAHHVNDVFLDNVKVPSPTASARKARAGPAPSSCWPTSGWASPRCRPPSAALKLRDIARAEPANGATMADDPAFAAQIADLDLQVQALEMSELRALSTMALGGAPGPEVSTSRSGVRRSSSASPNSPWRRGEYAAPYQPGMLFQDTNETPVGPDHARRPRRATSISARRASTAAATKFRRTSCRRWSSGYNGASRLEDFGEQMDLSLSDEQKQLQDAAERFVRDKYTFENRRKIAATEKGLAAGELAQMAELGWLGMAFSEEDGGYGGGPIETMIVMEQFGKGLVLEPFLPTVVLGGGMIAKAGSKAQKEALLAPMIEGKKQFAFAWLERQSRYNWPTFPAQGDQGRQRLVALGPQGRRLQRAVGRPHHRARPHSGSAREEKGLTLFVVDAKAKGITRRDYRPRTRCAPRSSPSTRSRSVPTPCWARSMTPSAWSRMRSITPSWRCAPRRPAAWTRSTRRPWNTSRRASSSACRSASSACCSIAWSTASPTPRKRAR